MQRFLYFPNLCITGKPVATFEVHRIILAARCPYFRAAFANPTDDAKARKTEIVDGSKESVEMLLRYIYCAQLPKEIEVQMVITYWFKAAIAHVCLNGFRWGVRRSPLWAPRSKTRAPQVLTPSRTCLARGSGQRWGTGPRSWVYSRVL